ncbi:MAG: hypothetical protein WB493_02920 [Anaeromyxobacteraceae bacterium]
MRVLVALATAVLLLAGVAAPHHHASPGGSHECVACTVGAGLEAHDATPSVAPAAPRVTAAAPAPADGPVTGAPLGATPGQSPPA